MMMGCIEAVAAANGQANPLFAFAPQTTSPLFIFAQQLNQREQTVYTSIKNTETHIEGLNKVAGSLRLRQPKAGETFENSPLGKTMKKAIQSAKQELLQQKRYLEICQGLRQRVAAYDFEASSGNSYRAPGERPKLSGTLHFNPTQNNS